MPALGGKTEVFADGADLSGIRALASNPMIRGFTTNPTLMRAAGIEDYEAFAKAVLEVVDALPISFEVFSDEFDEMDRQARRLASWGDNVFVKIPISNTRAESSADLIATLSSDGIKLNVTALMTSEQVRSTVEAFAGGTEGFVSVFAGRIADTGVDPIPTMVESLEYMRAYPNLRLIWASPREMLNLVQAEQIGCHVITVTHDLLKKLPTLGKDLMEFSLDTVKMFADDAARAGYTL
jgi:transaldolase